MFVLIVKPFVNRQDVKLSRIKFSKPDTDEQKYLCVYG